MTEEQNLERKEGERCNCFCKSKGFQKFLVVALGTFVGVFCALSLFAALHKPPMRPCPMGYPMMRPPMVHYHHFNKGHFDRFDKQVMRHKFDKKIQQKAQERVDD